MSRLTLETFRPAEGSNVVIQNTEPLEVPSSLLLSLEVTLPQAELVDLILRPLREDLPSRSMTTTTDLPHPDLAASAKPLGGT